MFIFPYNEFFQLRMKGSESTFLVEVDTRRWVVSMFHGAIPYASAEEIIQACQTGKSVGKIIEASRLAA